MPGKKMHADHVIPLRAGGIHDARNFQALCDMCNTKKSDQIDPKFYPKAIRTRISKVYGRVFRDQDSVQTIERKLKTALVSRIGMAIADGTYKEKIAAVKKRVNGQWVVNRAYRRALLGMSVLRRV